MKNNLYNKGLIIPILLGVISILIIGGGIYFYSSKKVDAPVVVDNKGEEQINNESKEQSNNELGKYEVGSNLTTENPTPAFKIIKSSLFDKLDFTYPENLISISYEEPQKIPAILLSHSFPYKHVNSCDMKDGSSINNVTDFNASFKIYNLSLINSIKKDNPQNYNDLIEGNIVKIQPGFVDNFEIDSIGGYKISIGAEGCGYSTYYFPVSINETLVIKRDYYLQTLQVGREKLIGIPEFISESQEEKIFNNMLSSIKVFERPGTMGLKVYFRKGELVCLEKNIDLEYYFRVVPKTQSVAKASIDELLKGPTQEEKNTGYWSDIPSGTILKSINIKDGQAFVDFNDKIESGITTCNGGGTRLSQIKQTLLQFPTIKSVVISVNGKTENIFQP